MDGRTLMMTTAPITVALTSPIGIPPPTLAEFTAIASSQPIWVAGITSSGRACPAPRQSLGLKDRQRHHRHRDGLMGQSEQDRNLIEQRDNAEGGLQRDRCRQP